MDDFKPTRNYEAYKARVELRRSNAAVPHEDRRTKRARTRADAKRRAITDQ